MLIPFDDIRAASRRIQALSPPTPLVHSEYFSRTLGAKIYLKLELLNPTRSFKTRGAANALLTLDEAQRAHGVVTASGGNHGLGVAYVAQCLGIPARIYLPENTPDSKVTAFDAYQAEIVMFGASWAECNPLALAAAQRENMAYIHPFDDDAVMAGQGTIGLEILRARPETSLVIASIGGGGLIAGIASAIAQQSPGARVYGVETVGADSMAQSFRRGRPITLPAITSIANTLGAPSPGERQFAIVREHVADVAAVSDADAVAAMLECLEQEKLLVEPAMSCIFAALKQGAISIAPEDTVVVVVCGGNATLADLQAWRRQFHL